VESRADLLFKDQDGGKAILIDVTPASGLSRYVKLHRYFPGAVAELAEQRKAKAYSRLWNVEAERARLIFFAVELSGCFGPEAQTNVSDDSRDGGRRTGCTRYTRASPSGFRSTGHCASSI
jgi:hypothetical protein